MNVFVVIPKYTSANSSGETVRVRGELIAIERGCMRIADTGPIEFLAVLVFDNGYRVHSEWPYETAAESYAAALKAAKARHPSTSEPC